MTSVDRSGLPEVIEARFARDVARREASELRERLERAHQQRDEACSVVVKEREVHSAQLAEVKKQRDEAQAKLAQTIKRIESELDRVWVR